MEEQEIEAGSEPQRQRLRIRYEKGEAIKFISHQDEFRLWERTLRRADLPLLYKQGFNPMPFIQFASPLGVGITGVAEPLDITLSATLPLSEVQERLTAKLPPGVVIHALEELPLKADALMNLMLGADYTMLIYAEEGEIDPALLRGKIADFLATPEVWRERQRKGKYYTYNLRALVFELEYRGYDRVREEHTIFLRVQQRAGATGRPDEVVIAMGLDEYARTLRRDRIYFADQAEDAAIFDHYPIVTQAEISPPHAPKPTGKSRFVQEEEFVPATDGVRGISQRAGDEFI